LILYKSQKYQRKGRSKGRIGTKKTKIKTKSASYLINFRA